MDTALFLISLQHDFLDETGRMTIGWEKAREIIIVANRLIRFQVAKGWPIVDIVSRYKCTDLFGNFLRKQAAIEGSRGCEIDPRIQSHSSMSFPKSKKSGFSNPYLSAYLQHKEIERVVICGVHAERCVLATALDARRIGLSVSVVTEGIASNNTAKHSIALTKMNRNGIKLITLEDYTH